MLQIKKTAGPKAMGMDVRFPIACGACTLNNDGLKTSISHNPLPRLPALHTQKKTLDKKNVQNIAFRCTLEVQLTYLLCLSLAPSVCCVSRQMQMDALCLCWRLGGIYPQPTDPLMIWPVQMQSSESMLIYQNTSIVSEVTRSMNPGFIKHDKHIHKELMYL